MGGLIATIVLCGILIALALFMYFFEERWYKNYLRDKDKDKNKDEGKDRDKNDSDDKAAKT